MSGTAREGVTATKCLQVHHRGVDLLGAWGKELGLEQAGSGAGLSGRSSAGRSVTGTKASSAGRDHNSQLPRTKTSAHLAHLAARVLHVAPHPRQRGLHLRLQGKTFRPL